MEVAHNWLMAFHIVAVIAWIASMLIYPRLLVYRLEAEGNPSFEAAMDKAANRTRNMLLTPTIILVWLLGIGLVSTNFQGYASQPWFWVKIVMVLTISGLHGYFVSLGKKIARGEKPIPVKRLRALNELPFVLAIVAVIMVVVKPF